MRSEKGFTLVELAIVMTIIGLLIGGILKGQELMENARVTSTIAQIKSYEAATTTFRDTFAALPGDMTRADTRVPGCAGNANCVNTGTPGTGTASPGDGIIGTLGDVGNTNAAPCGSEIDCETVMFWTHMLLADLISGVSDAAINAAAGPNVFSWGEAYPAAKIGGGFHVKYGDGVADVAGQGGGCGAVGTLACQPSGIVLVLRNDPTAVLNQNAGEQPLTPLRAGQLDRKTDDGKSASGFVTGYGVLASCATGGPNADSYNEVLTTKDCGLIFRIQG